MEGIRNWCERQRNRWKLLLLSKYSGVLQVLKGLIAYCCSFVESCRFLGFLVLVVRIESSLKKKLRFVGGERIILHFMRDSIFLWTVVARTASGGGLDINFEIVKLFNNYTQIWIKNVQRMFLTHIINLL